MLKTDNQKAGPPSPRVRVRREPHRAVYDRPVINAILDAGFICYVGYEVEGQPYVTPTSYWREGNLLYWHGSSASRMLRHLNKGVSACVTVTHLDGLVLSRSGLNHAFNYRSVMALGTARVVADNEKLPALKRFMDQLFPGRWDEIRPPTAQEMKGTMIMVMPLDEVSAKVRNAQPLTDDADQDVKGWSGVIPLGMQARQPVGEPQRVPAPEVPEYATTINDRFAISLPFPLES